MIYEFPKHITINGRLFVVESQAEEDAVRAKVYPSEADEKARLTGIAQKHGLGFSERATINQMREALAINGYAPDEGP